MHGAVLQLHPKTEKTPAGDHWDHIEDHRCPSPILRPAGKQSRNKSGRITHTLAGQQDTGLPCRYPPLWQAQGREGTDRKNWTQLFPENRKSSAASHCTSHSARYGHLGLYYLIFVTIILIYIYICCYYLYAWEKMKSCQREFCCSVNKENIFLNAKYLNHT